MIEHGAERRSIAPFGIRVSPHSPGVLCFSAPRLLTYGHEGKDAWRMDAPARGSCCQATRGRGFPARSWAGEV